MLFRWVLGMNMDAESFNPTDWTRLREALVKHDIGQSFLHAVVARAQTTQLMGSEQLAVDGMLNEAWHR